MNLLNAESNADITTGVTKRGNADKANSIYYIDQKDLEAFRIMTVTQGVKMSPVIEHLIKLYLNDTNIQASIRETLKTQKMIKTKIRR